MAWLRWNFEVSCKVMVPRHGTTPLGWLISSIGVASDVRIECIQRKQVRGSRRVDFVIKVTLQKWKCDLFSLNGQID